MFFQDAHSGIYSDIGNYIKKNNGSFVQNTVEGMNRALTEKYAFFGEISVMDALAIEHCNLTIIKEKFFYGNWGLGMKKGWKYKSQINAA